VYDKGEGISYDVTLFEKDINLDERGNTERAGNIRAVIKVVNPNAPAMTDKGLHVVSAKVAGVVGAGGSLTYDRPPGLVKLEVSPGGDEAFAPWFTVEGGKTYRIDYYYMKQKFEITESRP